MKKKVFFIIPSLAGGGAERVIVNLVNNINKSEYDVTLVCLSGEVSVYEINKEVSLMYLNVKRVRNAPFKIIKLIKKEKPDLILSTLGHLNMMLLILRAFSLLNTKLIIRQTNIKSLTEKENKVKRFINKKMNYFYKFADQIVCQSELMKSDFIKSTKVKQKILTIYNPVDIESILFKSLEPIKYKINYNNKNIFFVGRLIKIKRIPLIIDAFNKYKKQNSKSNLYILGEGPDKKEIENYIKKNELDKSVKMIGFVENPHKWLRHADLFILASEHEGMPNMLLETIALEIPVLILKHPGGTKDIIDLLDIQERFVDDLEITEKYFRNYKSDIKLKLEKHFGVKNIVKQYEKLFKNVIERK